MPRYNNATDTGDGRNEDQEERLLLLVIITIVINL